MIQKQERSWCYLGKYESLPKDYKAVIHKQRGLYTNDTQTPNTIETLNSRSIRQRRQGRQRADRLAWLGYHPYEVMVAGSSLARPTQPFSKTR